VALQFGQVYGTQVDVRARLYPQTQVQKAVQRAHVDTEEDPRGPILPGVMPQMVFEVVRKVGLWRMCMVRIGMKKMRNGGPIFCY
jgi:hypothetical protein